MTDEDAGTIRPTCANCGAPIRLHPADGQIRWLHDQSGGTFRCRDAQTRMCLNTYAEPVPLPIAPTSAGASTPAFVPRPQALAMFASVRPVDAARFRADLGGALDRNMPEAR